MSKSFFIISDELSATLSGVRQLKDRYTIYDHILDMYIYGKAEVGKKIPNYLIAYCNYAWRCVLNLRCCMREKYRVSACDFYRNILAPLSRNDRNNFIEKARRILFEGENPDNLSFSSSGLKSLFSEVLSIFSDELRDREQVSNKARKSSAARWQKSTGIKVTAPMRIDTVLYDRNTKLYAALTILYNSDAKRCAFMRSDAFLCVSMRSDARKIPPKNTPLGPSKKIPLKRIFKTKTCCNNNSARAPAHAHTYARLVSTTCLLTLLRKKRGDQHD